MVVEWLVVVGFGLLWLVLVCGGWFWFVVVNLKFLRIGWMVFGGCWNDDWVGSYGD